MYSVLSSVQSLRQMFVGKTQEFIDEIENVHIVWLEEIQQEANRMFSRDFNAEPELMPKTPSQKRNTRRKRVSVGRQEENQTKRRFSKGRRSNLRSSSVKSLNFIAEEEGVPGTSAADLSHAAQAKRPTRKNRQTKFEETEDLSPAPETEAEKKPEPIKEQWVDKKSTAGRGEDKPDVVQPPPELPAPDVAAGASSAEQSQPEMPAPEVTVSISSTDRLSAENAKSLQHSPGRAATKLAIANGAQKSRRSSVRCSLKLRHSMAGLRHSMTQESVRRASRRSMLKKKAARTATSQCSSNNEDEVFSDAVEEEGEVADTEDNAVEEVTEASSDKEPVNSAVRRVTRSVVANSPKLATLSLYSAEQKPSTPSRKIAGNEKPKSECRSRRSVKRKSPDSVEESPTKRFSPPKKSQSTIRPNMRSFLHTVQKNQMLMMTPNTLGRSSVIKSFIKHTTPLKIDPKTKERYKLEALKKKQEQEEERMKKMEEEKKRKQEELKRKRDERMKRFNEAKVKEEQREEEKKKKFEQKMAQIEVKNERLAEEKAKKKAAIKRQEELEQKKKLEEEAKKKKMEEEKRQQELLAKKKEEEEQARKLAEARRALELKREQERERERQLERERLAAAERERVEKEKEKALALQRELERAAREKERRELEEKRKALEEKRKLEEQLRLAAEQKAAKEREAAKQAAAKQTTAALNVTVDIERSVLGTPVGKGAGLNMTVDIEKSPQSYVITPKGGNKPGLPKSAEDYGMDQNSDDSTDDESAPRKPIPSWAESHNLNQLIMKQYFNPPDLYSYFGVIQPLKLEDIFYKSKPRYFKRTSSAVWHLPPGLSK